jgi:membrane-associated protein
VTSVAAAHAATQLAFNPINAHDWIQWLGNYAVVGICALVFAETGLMVGFFLPGDSLLFIAGLLTGTGTAAATQGSQHLSLPLLLILVPICAIAGAQLGHFLGARFGRPMFDRPNSRLFKREYVDKAEEVFDRYGETKAVFIARFIPIVRTFMNPVAGVLEMPAKKFFTVNVIGGIVWADGVLLLGRFLNTAIGGPDKVDKYILPITGLIVLISVVPIILEVRKARKAKKQAGGPGGRGDRDVVAATGRHRSR